MPDMMDVPNTHNHGGSSFVEGGACIFLKSAFSSKCQIGRGLACGTLGCAGRVAVVKLGGSC